MDKDSEEYKEWMKKAQTGGCAVKPFRNIIKLYQQNDIPVYYYKGKPYAKIVETKIKASGILDFVSGMNSNKRYVDLIFVEKCNEWVDVVIYECLYENPDGQIWVREKTQFYELFKTKEDEKT